MTTKTRALALLIVPFLAATRLEPAHLQQAELIAREIDQADNEYAHKDCFIHWKGEADATRYENRTDCSDFLDLLLKHAYHLTDAQMKSWTGRSRPLASTWFETISQGRHFEVIGRIEDIAPGDVLAIQYPPDETDTGHIMIAAEHATKRNASVPIQANTTQWELPIIDSSKSGHGPTDTRRESGNTFHSGVGAGVLRLYGNDEGSIVGYSWSTVAASKFVSIADKKMVIGRMKLPLE